MTLSPFMSVVLALISLFIIATLINTKLKVVWINREKRELESRLATLEPAIDKKYNDKWQAHFGKTLKDRLQKLESNLRQAASRSSGTEAKNKIIHSMTSAVEMTADQTCKRLCNEIRATADGITAQFRHALSDKLWKCYQQYKRDDGPIMLPKGTRVAYTKGIRTVLLIEEEPTVRCLSFSQAVDDGPSIAGVTRKGFRRYNLSLPYLYFMTTFDDQKCASFSVFLSNTRMKDMSHKLHPVPLPNVWRDKRNHGEIHFPMCMGENTNGESFWSTINGLSIPEQTEAMISGFWSRTFNGHLGEGVYKSIDKRLSSLSNWEKESQQDPLFTLTINWPDGKTASHLVQQLLDWRPKVTLDVAEQNLHKLFDQASKELDADIKKLTAQTAITGFGKLMTDKQAEQLLEQYIANNTQDAFKAISNV